MLRNVKGENVQAKLAELFGRMLEKKGAEVFEVEAAKAIAGLSAMIYMNLGPRPAGCDFRTIPGVVERDVTALLKRFGYQIIPADEAEPIGKDVAMLPEGPLVADLRNVVQPHLGGHRMIRMEVFYSGEMRDLFVDAAAVPKDLPRNERATAIYRQHFLSLNPGVDPESLPYMAGPPSCSMSRCGSSDIILTLKQQPKFVIKTPKIIFNTRIKTPSRWHGETYKEPSK